MLVCSVHLHLHNKPEHADPKWLIKKENISTATYIKQNHSSRHLFELTITNGNTPNDFSGSRT